MKNLLIVLLSGFLLLSCESSRKDSLEYIQKEIEKSTSKFIQSSPDEVINSLKFVILKENRYYIDEIGAQNANTDEKILKNYKSIFLT